MKKRKSLFFLGMLFLSFVLFSCKNDDSDDSINIKITGDLTSAENEKLSDYGNLIMNITQASKDLTDFKTEDSQEIKIKNSISINKKLKDVMEQFSIEFYLVPFTEEQVDNLNKKKQANELGHFNLTYEITGPNAERKGEKNLTFYASEIKFYADNKENPYDSLVQCRTTDCIWIDDTASLSVKDDSAEEISQEPEYISYDGEIITEENEAPEKYLDVDDSSILELSEKKKANAFFINNVKPSDNFFDFGDDTTAEDIQFGDVFYFAQSDYDANKETIKNAFDKGALLMMRGGDLDNVEAIFKDLSIDTSYITETELENKGDPVFFIGKYSDNVFFEVLYTEEASRNEAANKLAVNQMAKQIITAFNNLDDIVKEIKENPNNQASSIRAANGEEIKNILKNFGTADATISQRFYQKIPIKYTWNYLRNDWDGALKKYRQYGKDYELIDAHYRKLLVWFIHIYPNKEKGEKYGKHYYYIQDMPSFTYKNTYFGQVTQAVKNNTSPYDYYGGGHSPLTIAKTQEFYGREAEISFEPANRLDIPKVEWCTDSPITQDVDLKRSSTSGWSFTATANGSVGSGGKKKAGIEASASYSFSNTVEWEEKAVTIERLSEPGVANFSWRYKMRPADFKFGWFCRASTEYVDNTPCVTAKTTLMPEAYSQYVFSVSDEYVRKLPFKMTMVSTLERLAGKFGTNCCQGTARAEQSDIISLPYDRYFNYETGEASETIVE